MVPMLGKASFEQVVGQNAGLGKAIHPFANFNVHTLGLGVHQVLQVVLVNDFLWNDVQGNAHKQLKSFHWGAQVKVFDVNAHESGIGSGDHTVEKDFGCGEVRGSGADTEWVIDASHGKPSALYLFLLWSQLTHKACICDFVASRDIRFANEEDCVGSFDVIANTLCQPTKFVGAGV